MENNLAKQYKKIEELEMNIVTYGEALDNILSQTVYVYLMFQGTYSRTIELPEELKQKIGYVIYKYLEKLKDEQLKALGGKWVEDEQIPRSL